MRPSCAPPWDLTHSHHARSSSVEPYRPLVQRLIGQKVEMTAIYQQLRDDHLYTGSYSAVRRFVKQLCPHRPDAVVRVHTPHGDLVKTQFGSAEVKRARKTGLPLSIGDDLKAASSDALKKASSLLGLALDLYRSDDDKPDQNGNGHAEGNGRIPLGPLRGKTDPMTAFWLAVKERELSREEGKALLERAGGDPGQALALLDS
jgi:hypothetical protein